MLHTDSYVFQTLSLDWEGMTTMERWKKGDLAPQLCIALVSPLTAAMNGQAWQSSATPETSAITMDLLRGTLQLFRRVRARKSKIPPLFDYNLKGLIGHAAGYLFRMNHIEEGLLVLRDSLASIGPPLLFSQRTALVAYATSISAVPNPDLSIYQEVVDLYLRYAKQNPLDFGDLLSLCTSLYDAGIVFAKVDRFDVASSITQLALSFLDRVIVSSDHTDIDTPSEDEKEEQNTFLAELREWKGEGRFLLALFLVWHARNPADYERAWGYLEQTEKESWSWNYEVEGNLKKALDIFSPKLANVVNFGRGGTGGAHSRGDEAVKYARSLGVTRDGPFVELWVRH